MAYVSHEFYQALVKTRIDHPTISAALAETVMKKFVERWESNREKKTFEKIHFGELIRLTLNELNIAGKPTRQMYSALIGHYYSQHAAYKNKRQTRTKRKHSKPHLPPPFHTRAEVSGQLAWEL